MYLRLLLLFCLALAAPVTAAADDEVEKPHDLEGSHDHPLVKRYPGGLITEFREKEFETFQLIVADAKEGEENRHFKTVEGKYLDATYTFPKGVSCTQIRRNFENAFKTSGMTVHAGKQPPFDDRGYGGDNLGWVSAEGSGKGAGLFVLVTCGEGDGQALSYLVVVEQAAMVQKVEVDATAMTAEIEKTGHIALYGIVFASGKAEVSPASAKTLEQIAALLKNKPEWKLRVEGHTDNVGKAKDNLELSKRRAAAVRDHLVKKLGIAVARLSAEGYGDTRPLESNDTDAGKAKNRRVELSKQ